MNNNVINHIRIKRIDKELPIPYGPIPVTLAWTYTPPKPALFTRANAPL